MKKILVLIALLIPVTANAYYVKVFKESGIMNIYDDGVLYKTYNVRVGLNEGAKTCDGDKKTPTGKYYIKDKRDSKYVKFLEISYPNASDLKRAKEAGCYAGDSIGIHYYNKEYTNDLSTMEGSLGCITVWNKKEILEINEILSVGTEIEILE